LATRRASRFIHQAKAGPHAEHNELVAFYSERFRFHRQTSGNLDEAQDLADADTQRHALERGLVWKVERERAPKDDEA